MDKIYSFSIWKHKFRWMNYISNDELKLLSFDISAHKIFKNKNYRFLKLR